MLERRNSIKASSFKERHNLVKKATKYAGGDSAGDDLTNISADHETTMNTNLVGADGPKRNANTDDRSNRQQMNPTEYAIVSVEKGNNGSA